ncbi:unnamed protein product [Adineta ricciae]|uniref:Uncharacterized protein n=1 Tax=Adineta ricciae TaxID=249248 RepID=A0A814XSL2_ADIRI|nr:unnamed protein product [Adineta ricciae]
MFHVIDSVESENNGPVIPLYNLKERLVKMLNISERSVYRLTHELHHSRCKEMKKISQERKEMGETSVKNLRSRTIVYSTLKRQQYSTSNAPAKILCRRHTASSTYPSTNHVDHLVPQALFPEKQMHSGRPNIVLSEQGKDLSRVKFDKLVQEKVYPTLEKLLKRLTEQYADFPIYSTSTLCKKNEEPWFRIPTNIKDKNCIGFTSFCCDKREIFQILEEFRKDNVYLYYHDETWINLREVKRSIWTLNGEGEIKKKWTEGSRLAVSALIDVDGYHIPSVVIRTCAEDYNMD